MADRMIEERTLEPGESAKFGRPFNATTQQPHLVIRIEVPGHVRNQVEGDDELLGSAEEPQKAYRVFTVRNRSSWPAFVTFVELLDN
jgi:hypothetical protein